jgi:hypothetical protein
MPDLAPHPVVPEPSDDEHEVLSPELVMVDPGLRDRLASLPVFERPAAPAPEEPATREVEREEELPPEHELRPAPEAGTSRPPAPRPPAQPEVAYYTAEEQPRRRRRWPIVVAVVAGLAVAAAAGVLLERTRTGHTSTSAVDPTTGRIAQPASSLPATTVAATAPTPVTSTPHPPPRHAPKPASTTPSRTAARSTTAPAGTTPTPVVKHPPKPTTTPTHKPTKPTTHVATSSKPPPVPATTPVKLAWAPTAGASAYEVELLRDSKPVFHTRTTLTSMIVKVRTHGSAPVGALTPGAYEWIVWPIVHGHRATPTVQSKLNLPR